MQRCKGLPLNMLKLIGKILVRLKFSLEISNDNKLDCLDLNTQTDLVIFSHSSHYNQHKLSASHSYINRLLTLLLSNLNYNKDVLTIKQIGVNDHRTVDRIINKINFRRIKRSAYPMIVGAFSLQLYVASTFINDLSFHIQKLFNKNLKNESVINQI